MRWKFVWMVRGEKNEDVPVKVGKCVALLSLGD